MLVSVLNGGCAIGRYLSINLKVFKEECSLRVFFKDGAIRRPWV